jgi:hypothetical protein
VTKSAEGIVSWAHTWRGKTRRVIEILNVKWDKQEARREDELTLTADVKGALDGTEVEIQIFEHDADGDHDFIKKLLVEAKDEKVEAKWKFEYHKDIDDIPSAEENGKGYNPPEYFFKVIVDRETAKSGLLEFKDFVKLELVDEEGNPIGGQKYILHLPDGSKREGVLDDWGCAYIEDVPPGKYNVVYPDISPEIEVDEVAEDDLSASEQEGEEEIVNYEEEDVLEEDELIDYFDEENGDEEDYVEENNDQS